MRWPRTLSLYFSREIALFSLLCFAGVALLLLSQQLLERLDELVAIGVGGSDLPRVLGFIFAIMASHALPIAFAFGVTLTLARLAASCEIVAIRSLGIGTGALVGPVLAIALLLAATTGWLLSDVEPRARYGLRRSLADVALRGTIVQGGRFRGVQDRVIYVDERSPEGDLDGVMIHDSTNPARPYAVFAESGALRYDGESGITRLTLHSGQILLDPDASDPTRVQLVTFDECEYAFDALTLLRGRYDARSPDELDRSALREVLGWIDAGAPLRNLRFSDRKVYEVELHRRAAMPLAPVWFGAIAVALGAGRRRTRSVALVACAATVFGYYAAMTAGIHLANEGQLAPWLAAWSPNAAFAALAGLLVWQLARSRGE